MCAAARVSVIVPFFNAERYLAQCLDSVLAQTRPPVEVLAMDDGSTDRSGEIARTYGERVQYHFHENAGPGATRNRGIQLARGDFVAFLDADDLWMPDKIERQLRAFAREPELDLVFGHMEQFHSEDLSPEDARRLVCDRTPQASTLISCLLARRSVFERVGLLDPRTRTDFVDWYLRACEGGVRTTILPEVVARRRLHLSNLSRTTPDSRREYLRHLKASLDRRRTVAAPAGPRVEAAEETGRRQAPGQDPR